jgi:hypothetical protein
MASKAKSKLPTWLYAIGAIFALIFGIGYVFNIIAIHYGDMPANVLLLRVVGVFVPPLGAVLGWF